MGGGCGARPLSSSYGCHVFARAAAARFVIPIVLLQISLKPAPAYSGVHVNMGMGMFVGPDLYQNLT